MKRYIAVFVVMASLLVVAAPALAAEWYAYNYQTSAYGAKADVYTPSSAPYLGDWRGESSWVGVGTSRWVQTGWLYQSGLSNAVSYTEYNIDGTAYQSYWGAQNWGYFKNYRVSYDSSTGCWDTFIDGSRKVSVYSGNLPNPPTTLWAEAEVHESSSTELNTFFDNVEWVNSSGTWNYFSQNHRHADSPYQITNTSTWYFTCYGP